jgi:hypothetical protein
MNNTPITLLADFYKLSHRKQYPEGTTKVYSTLTPRSNKYAPYSDEIVWFGLQYFIKEYLIDRFNKDFFNKPKKDVVKEYKRLVEYSLGKEYSDTKHIEELHDLGYLPIKISALPEGSLVPMRVPVMTIENTHDKFFWLTNFLETILSATIWLPTTSATLAYSYRKILNDYAMKTTGSLAGVDFQGHDFSMRGMSSEQSAATSGAGHLLSFKGTDTIPSILFLEKYYNANIEAELVGTSIPATEHSVMCSYEKQNEKELLKHLLENVYPTGIFSVVCDTWDFWKVVTEYLPELKEVILNRNGKLVVRPDSGNPVDIICGTKVKDVNTPEEKGLVELLYEIFGGEVNKEGFKVLDPHIGAIYGDSITLEIAKEICEKLYKKGFATTNVVFGIGSYSYQYATRDTFGFAVKATYAVVNSEERMLFKDPKTDSGIKKSQKGLVVVSKDKDHKYIYEDGFVNNSEYKIKDNLLRTIFFNGKLLRQTSLSEIREKLIFSNLK